ncbi:MAG: isoaspartyl peptidase/L-asparaginase [Planctomycetota bacterium]|nr:isoaspartyl peptidase/L-asparaginase [Planctomycetota bacterium]
MIRIASLLWLMMVLLPGCLVPDHRTEDPPQRWAIAIHGGAGALSKGAPEEEQRAYRESLQSALTIGAGILQNGGEGLDAVEQVIRFLEDDPLFNAGLGAVFNSQGKHELDASIMDGSDLSCGAVAGVRTVRHPITLARKVMTDTRHVLFAGEGAETFASQCGVELVENSFFSTNRRREQWTQRRKPKKGTVGVAVLDRQGHLAAGTSTGGMTDKRWGRVGDSPIIGAGTYADDRACAVSCTGTGEEYIRHAVAHSVAARMMLAGQDLQSACDAMIHEVLQPDDGGLIAVDAAGNIAFSYSTQGMYRAAADSSGRFEVGIHEQMMGDPGD